MATGVSKSEPGREHGPRYRAYGLHNYLNIPQLAQLSAAQRFDIGVVGQVLPFKVNNFVLDELIDWAAVPDDPMFTLTFPRRDMLRPHHYEQIAALIRQGADAATIRAAADAIRLQLNPHPAGQLKHNIPEFHGEPMPGVQHKYPQTVLFFPSQGQTCHAYCSFCFRWPQFVGMSAFRFAGREVELLIDYIRAHPEITDVLFTGGDPLIMSAKNLASYLLPLAAADLPKLRRIRIGTKVLSYWPYKFLSDADAEDTLALFRRVGTAGKHLAIMAHFNHWRELQPRPVREAIARVRETGAEIRTQSPLLRHINDDSATWARLWSEQVDLGCIPYYMFVVRDTGAQHYFAVPLVRAWEIFRDAYRQVSGLCRTVRGPSMSTNPGKVQVLGVAEIRGERVVQLRFLQGRNPDWVNRPFFARYDADAVWLNELRPAFGESQFYFEPELELYYRENLSTSTADNFE